LNYDIRHEYRTSIYNNTTVGVVCQALL